MPSWQIIARGGTTVECLNNLKSISLHYFPQQNFWSALILFEIKVLNGAQIILWIFHGTVQSDIWREEKLAVHSGSDCDSCKVLNKLPFLPWTTIMPTICSLHIKTLYIFLSLSFSLVQLWINIPTFPLLCPVSTELRIFLAFDCAECPTFNNTMTEIRNTQVFLFVLTTKSEIHKIVIRPYWILLTHSIQSEFFMYTKEHWSHERCQRLLSTECFIVTDPYGMNVSVALASLLRNTSQSTVCMKFKQLQK